MFEGKLGTKPGEFGVTDYDEEEPVAPMSVAVSSSADRVYVLDQLNRRIQVFLSGKLEKELPIESVTANDLVLLNDTTLVLLDRDRNSLIFMSPDGVELSKAKISGPGILGGGDIWKLYARSDGLWAQVGKSDYLHLFSATGEPVKRKRRSGFPSLDGEWFFSVTTLGDGSIHVVKRNASGKPKYTEAHIVPETRNGGLLAADCDSAGNLYVVSLPSNKNAGESARRVDVLSPDLKVVRNFSLEPATTVRDSFRTVAIAKNGAVLQLDVKEDRVAVRRY